MSRTTKDRRHTHKEAWSKRPGSGYSLPIAKKIYRGIERAAQRRALKQEIGE